MKYLPAHLFFLSVLLLCSCSSGKNWEETQKENTIEAYRAFLTANPETEHKDSILLLIKGLEWLKLKTDSNLVMLDSFQLKYPDDEIYKDSIHNLKLSVRFKETTSKNTIEAYQQFLKDFSFNSYSSTVNQKIEALKWTEAKKANTKEKYLEFLAEYKYENYKDSIKLKFDFKDFTGYALTFSGSDKDDTGPIEESYTLNLNKNGKLTGTFEGNQEGDNYYNSWSGEVKGKFTAAGFEQLESRLMGMSDEADSQPEPWGELVMEIDVKNWKLETNDRVYKLVEISKISENN